MADTHYLDFDLLISPTAEGYRARVLSSPSGTATGTFVLPFSDLELENFVLRLQVPRGVRKIETSGLTQAKDLGGRLFETVFRGDIAACLRSSVVLAGEQDAGVRIRLRLSDAPELASLPWEYLYNPSLNRFLSLSVDTPVVRYVDQEHPVRPLTVQPPLRVLAIISSPSDVASLDVDREWNLLTRALRSVVGAGQVQITRVEAPTLSDLHATLMRGTYHVLHFVGHGVFDNAAQDGALLFEDQFGRSRPVSAQQLSVVLHNHPSLRLAVLNACEGGRTSSTEPFAGTALSLLQQGVPAVIAMQFSITDEAAITFSGGFYAALAAGYPIDAALIHARLAVWADGNEVEWATPVLYTSAPDGRIFTVIAPSSGQVEKRQETLLADLYARAAEEMAGRRWEEAVALLEQIEAQQEEYRDVPALLIEARAASSREAVETRQVKDSTIDPAPLPVKREVERKPDPDPKDMGEDGAILPPEDDTIRKKREDEERQRRAEPSPWQRLIGTTSGRIAAVAGLLVIGVVAVVAWPRPSPPVAVSTPLPTAAPTATFAFPTLTTTRTSLFLPTAVPTFFMPGIPSSGKVLYHTYGVTLKDAADGNIAEALADTKPVRDFVAEGMFFNPSWYLTTPSPAWDYGFIFRRTGSNKDYRLILNSDKTWHLNYGRGTDLASGTLTHFTNSQTTCSLLPAKFGRCQDWNTIRLVAKGSTGWLILNGVEVHRLDLSQHMEAGSVAAVADALTVHVTAGRHVPVNAFSVWSLKG